MKEAGLSFAGVPSCLGFRGLEIWLRVSGKKGLGEFSWFWRSSFTCQGLGFGYCV